MTLTLRNTVVRLRSCVCAYCLREAKPGLRLKHHFTETPDLPDPNLILFHSLSGPYRPLPVLFLDNHLLVQREIVVIGEDELACACLARGLSGQGMDTPAYISTQFTDRRDYSFPIIAVIFHRPVSVRSSIPVGPESSLLAVSAKERFRFQPLLHYNLSEVLQLGCRAIGRTLLFR